MKRRLEIARGLMHSPRVLFLDEPTVGLDPQTRSSIWSYIRELRQREKITIFLTTHYMDEAEYCDRIAIIDDGQIVALDTPEALKAKVGKDRVTIRTADDTAGDRRLRAEVRRSSRRMHEGSVMFGVEGGEQFVPRLFAELGIPISAISVRAAIARRRVPRVHRHDDPRHARRARSRRPDGRLSRARRG